METFLLKHIPELRHKDRIELIEERKMKRAWNSLLIAFALFSAQRMAMGAATPLVLQCGSGTCTPQMLDSSSGSGIAALPFAGTTTYDFYSPALTASVSLAKSDKGGGVIFMQNTGASSANDFSVSGRIQYYDYDPATGLEVLMVDTGAASGHKNVNHGQTVNWAIPNVALSASYVIASGHMIHIAVMISLVSGNPGSFGQVLYNGASNASTVALFPQSATVTWPFAAPVPAARAEVASATSGAMAVSFAGIPGMGYQIQATTNLTTGGWITIGTTNADVNGLLRFVDVDAKSFSSRFYRTLKP